MKVHVEDLRDNVFYGRLYLKHGAKEVDIDARPSDCIALAVGANVITVTADAAVSTAVATLTVFCDSAPVLERALDVLFILHADHEQNCGTNAMRAIGSSLTDPYSAMAGAADHVPYATRRDWRSNSMDVNEDNIGTYRAS